MIEGTPMQIKTTFPHAIRELANCWIPLADGARLAARIWLPTDAEQSPVPAILEYLPYRKTDGTTARDAIQHPYFAGHGYACIRVDMRGTGDADGILYDEYLRQEQEDALEVLTWIAAQPWCTGDVGIIGISWGGFNGLQIAARRPPELKAIITLCSTDDRYADDIHYAGGCQLALEHLPWASTMFAYNALPPDPRFVGEQWRTMWHQRMAETPPYIAAWLSHQRRDEFWQHGSVCEDFGAITCPVYAVGGWADGYTNAVPRLLAGLTAPRKGLIGPWPHMYPELDGSPGPTIGFLQEALRWWDQWLKGEETGIMEEPMLRVWLQESVPPADLYTERPGHWIAEPSWPTPNVQEHSYYLVDEILVTTPTAGTARSLLGHPFTGADAGLWCAYGRRGDQPLDQRAEDGRSLSFTSAPLAEPMTILGFPEVTLRLTVDQPVAQLVVRLCAVAPDGVSTLVTRGVLNLTHRASHTNPTPLTPGQGYTVRVQLGAIAHQLPAGHRWRIAVSPTYWPWLWPSPKPVTLTLHTGANCQLDLPVRRPSDVDQQLAPFAAAEGAPPQAVEVLRTPSQRKGHHYDVVKRHLHHFDEIDAGRRLLLDNGIERDAVSRNYFDLSEDDPCSAQVRCEHSIALKRSSGPHAFDIRVETVSTMSADAERFYVTNVLEAYEGSVRVFAKTWDFQVARDGV
jgi:putative CocE/NonD family hydrolase